MESDEPSDRRFVPGWVALSFGGILGSWMSLAVLKVLVLDFPHPDIGWGVLGLYSIQPVALFITVPAAIHLVLGTTQERWKGTFAIATAVVLWVAFAMVGLTFDNSGC